MKMELKSQEDYLRWLIEQGYVEPKPSVLQAPIIRRRHDPKQGIALSDMQRQDLVITSLYRNRQLHMSSDRGDHSIPEKHNCAILHFYITDDIPGIGKRTHIETYRLFSRGSLTYKEWAAAVHKERMQYLKAEGVRFHGWLTRYVRITPIRNGDVMLVVDADGCRFHEFKFRPRGKHAGKTPSTRAISKETSND